MKFKLDISRDWFFYIEKNKNEGERTEIQHLEKLGFIGYVEKREEVYHNDSRIKVRYVFNGYRPTIELSTLDEIINFFR